MDIIVEAFTEQTNGSKVSYKAPKDFKWDRDYGPKLQWFKNAG